jgi:hypothetical protein
MLVKKNLMKSQKVKATLCDLKKKNCFHQILCSTLHVCHIATVATVAKIIGKYFEPFSLYLPKMLHLRSGTRLLIYAS